MNGCLLFDNALKEVGGIEKVASSTYGRNMWRIMKMFGVLPTDERFQNLTTHQLNYIISSMILDGKEEELAMKGINPDEYHSDDDFSWEGELVLPDKDEAKSVTTQIKGIKQRLLDKRERGEQLTQEEQRSVEAYDTIAVKLKEAKEKELALRESGDSFEDNELKGVLSDEEYKNLTSNDKIDKIQAMVDRKALTEEEANEQAMDDILQGFNGEFD